MIAIDLMDETGEPLALERLMELLGVMGKTGFSAEIPILRELSPVCFCFRHMWHPDSRSVPRSLS